MTAGRHGGGTAASDPRDHVPELLLAEREIGRALAAFARAMDEYRLAVNAKPGGGTVSESAR